MKITKPKRHKKNEEVEAGKNAATSDLNYRYDFKINQRKMARFLAICKLNGETGPKVLRRYIENYLAHHEDIKL